MVDADGASRFEDLEVLWNEMDRINGKNINAAVVIGSRAHLVKTEAVVKVSLLPPPRLCGKVRLRIPTVL